MQTDSHSTRHPGRRRFLGLAGATGALLAAGRAVPARAQARRSLRFGSPQPAGSLYNQAIVVFADELARLSDGALTVDIFPGSELGGVAEMLSSVQTGALDMTIAVPAWHSNFVRPMDLFTLPYLADSPESLRGALDGELGRRVEALAEAAGFQYVGYWLMGGRHILNKVRPVRSPADMEGLKIRVINSQVYLQAFRALGANPVALDPAELYLALQQGVVDGFAYPLPDIVDARLYEVVSHLSLDAHVHDFFVVAMAQSTWSALAAEQQEMVRAAMQVSMDWQWAEQPKAIEAALATLRSHLEVTEITPTDRQRFIDATRPIYADFEDTIGRELLEIALRELGGT